MMVIVILFLIDMHKLILVSLSIQLKFLSHLFISLNVNKLVSYFIYTLSMKIAFVSALC